uniref:Uncharacterized protein n=1 Tax=Lactuca sativa TaxID=4236 RepID=A0A9R1V790_LACSA|nr:hypothetical protein LSAT_V11C600316950 [Lactuca sativa]
MIRRHVNSSCTLHKDSFSDTSIGFNMVIIYFNYYNRINSMLLPCKTGRLVSDVLISNMYEVFNEKIDRGRDKPIIVKIGKFVSSTFIRD